MSKRSFCVQRQRLALLAACLGLSGLPAVQAHPDKLERQLLTHFATGTHQPEGGILRDLTHNASARIAGAPIWTNIGPAQGILLNGFTDYLVIADSPAAAEKILPQKDFSVTAWVLLNEPREDGGIIGLAQDNGDFEKGWFLGYNRKSFTFTLSTKKADDGNGKLTRLVSKAGVSPGQWQHVGATYDGETMRCM
jgi:hypothetical protein